MSDKRGADERVRRAHRQDLRVEVLEGRALLAAAAETFTGPSLADLIQAAHQGQNTAPAGIARMLQALQSQLDSGPLADLSAGTVNGTDFVTEVQSLETSFEQNVDQQLSPAFPNVDMLLKLQGERIVADVTSLNQQNAVGLLSSADLVTQSQAAIHSLTGGPIFSLGTPLSAYASRTQSFEADLNTLAQSLSSTASPALTVAQVNATLQAEAAAYQADLHAGLQVTNPSITAIVDAAITTLENASTTIAQSGASNADSQTQLNAAIAAFDTAVLDTTGLFGPQGPISQAQARGRHY